MATSSAPKLCSLVFVLDEERVLLGMKKRGFGAGHYNGFGGKLEPTETMRECCARELYEESGLIVQPEKLRPRGVLKFHMLADGMKLADGRVASRLEVHVYSCTLCATGGTVCESEEMAPSWHIIDSVPLEHMWPDDKHWLPPVLKGSDVIGEFTFQDKQTIVEHRVDVLAAGQLERDELSASRRVDLLAGAITFLDTFSIGLLSPIQPTLLRSNLAGAKLHGILVSVSNAAALVAGTSFGRLSDVHSRRAAIVASVLTSIAGYGSFTLGHACGTERCYPPARLALPALGRVFAGVGRAALSAPLLALVSEHAQGSAATRMARSMATFGLGYSAGSGVGGLLSTGGAVERPLALILLCVLLQLVCACCLPHAPPITHVRVREPPASAAPARMKWLATLQLAMAARSTRTLLFLQFVSAASFQVYSATSAIYLQSRLGYSASELGFVLSYAGWAFSVQTATIIPRLLRIGVGSSHLLALAYACVAVGRFGLAAAAVLPTTPTVLVSYAVLNLGQGMNTTLLKALMSRVSGTSAVGLMLGVLNSVEKLAGVIAPLVGGYVYDVLGPTAPACIAGLVALVGSAVALLLPMEGKPPASPTIAPTPGHIRPKPISHESKKDQ